MPDVSRMMDLPCAFYHCLSTFPAQAVHLSGSLDFRIRSTESIVFQLRVVAGAPKSLSIWPRSPIVFMWRRYTPNTRRFFEPMIRTSHSPPSGRAIGRETLRRPASDRMLTNRTTSARGMAVSPDAYASVSSLVNLSRSRRTIVPSSPVSSERSTTLSVASHCTSRGG